MKQAERGCGVGRRAVQPRKYWTDLECLDTSPRLYFHWMVRGASGGGGGGGGKSRRGSGRAKQREREARRASTLHFFVLLLADAGSCWRLWTRKRHGVVSVSFDCRGGSLLPW